MRTRIGMLVTNGLLLAASFLAAQPPPGDHDGPGRAPSKEEFVARMMAFDKNKDGKLTKDEVTDERLHRLFERADANKDGVVTKEELEALFDREAQAAGRPGGFGPPPGGPGGFGPPGGGRFGPPGMGGFMLPPRPGEILPEFLQRRLNLTEEQKKKIAELQKEVDAGLDTILTADQKRVLKEMRERGPGGFGPPGFGGRRRPGGGRPPGEGGRPPRPGGEGPGGPRDR